MGTLRYAVITAFCCNGLAIAQASAQSSPAVDWSGFSVSALAGGGILTPETDAEGLDPSAYFSAASDLKQLKDAGSGSPTEWDWSASLQVGYSRQFGNIVLGVGATGDLLLWDEKRSSTQDWISLAGTEFTLKQRVEADWMVALRPRLGWAQDNWLVYVMAGPTLSRLKIETDYSDNVGTGAEGHGSDSETKLGYVIGIGGDYAIDKNWSVSAQYSYTDLGTVDTRTHVFNASQAANPGDIDSSVDLSSHMAMIGFTYRFDAF